MKRSEAREILDVIQREYSSLLHDKVLHEKVDASFKHIAYKVARMCTRDDNMIERMLRGRFI